MVNFHFPMVEFQFPIFLLPKPKVSIILFQYTNAFLCAKFGDLKPTIDEKQRPQIWTSGCFWVRRRNKIPQGNCDFISTKCFMNVNRSSGSTECAAESSKPRVMLWDQHMDSPSKNWENLNFSSDSAGLLAFASQRHVKIISTTSGAKRDPLARVPSKCWGTCCCARGPALHVAAANARAEVRARMHNRSIWCQGSSRTLSAAAQVALWLTQKRDMRAGIQLSKN